jgi:hypothetical protein
MQRCALALAACAPPLRTRCAATTARLRRGGVPRSVRTAATDAPPVPAPLTPGEVHLWWMDTRTPPVRAACCALFARRYSAGVACHRRRRTP